MRIAVFLFLISFGEEVVSDNADGENAQEVANVDEAVDVEDAAIVMQGVTAYAFQSLEHEMDRIIEDAKDDLATHNGLVEQQKERDMVKALEERRYHDLMHGTQLDSTMKKKKKKGVKEPRLAPGDAVREAEIFRNGPEAVEAESNEVGSSWQKAMAAVMSDHPFQAEEKGTREHYKATAKSAKKAEESHYAIEALIEERNGLSKELEKSTDNRDELTEYFRRLENDWNIFVSNVGRLMAAHQINGAERVFAVAEKWVDEMMKSKEKETGAGSVVEQMTRQIEEKDQALKQKMSENSREIQRTLTMAEKAKERIKAMQELSGYVNPNPSSPYVQEATPGSATSLQAASMEYGGNMIDPSRTSGYGGPTNAALPTMNMRGGSSFSSAAPVPLGNSAPPAPVPLSASAPPVGVGSPAAGNNGYASAPPMVTPSVARSSAPLPGAPPPHLSQSAASTIDDDTPMSLDDFDFGG